MRWIHTADWHLGHTLAGHSREHEHDRFLAFLVDAVEAEDADGLVVAGDVFDQGNPPASAQRAFFGALATLRARRPRLQVLVIGGNHDAAGRLDAAGPLLDALEITMIGGVPRADDGALALERLVVPLRERDGSVAAVCAAVPFLRAPELSTVAGAGGDIVVDGTRAILGRAIDAARATWPGVPAVVAGHCELAGARMSLTSERPLFGGQHALPSAVFTDVGVVYGALGHLHLAQGLAGGALRYSGSPIPLSMAERHYEHQIVVVDITATGASVRPLRVPRVVDFWRVPEDPAPIDVVLDQLRALDAPARPLHEQPFLDVRVAVDGPVPELRARVEAALAGKHVRLVRLERTQTTAPDDADGAALHDAAGPGLADLSAQVVFAKLYERQYRTAPPTELAAALQVLVDDAVRGGD